MNRRDFLQRLGGAAAAVALSPMLDLAEIIPAPSLAIGGDVIWGIPALVDDGTYNWNYMGISRAISAIGGIPPDYLK